MCKNHTIKNSIFYIRNIFKYDCKRIPGVIFTAFFNAIDTWFFNVLIVKLIIDNLVNSFDLKNLLVIVGVAISCKTVKLLYDAIWTYYVKLSDQKIIKGFQKKTFKKAENIDLECYDNSEFYDKYAHSINESSSRPIKFINSLFLLCSTLFAISLSGIYVIINEPVLLIFSIFPILGDSIIRTKMHKVREKRTNEIIPENKKIDYVKRTSYLRENATDIRVTNIHLILRRIFNTAHNKIIMSYKKYSNKFTGMYFISDLFTHLANTLIIIYLLIKIVVLKSLTISDFVAIKSAVSLISSNLGKIIERFQVFGEHSIYIGHFKSFCDYKNKVKFGQKVLPIDEIDCPIIEINNVNFKYREETVLKDINLSIKEGEKIAIVGNNGAGKSTLIKLLLHMYEPLSGTVKYKGEDIRNIRKEDYLSLFGIVFQEYNTYATTVSENISFNSNLSQEDINYINSLTKTFGLSESFKIDKSNDPVLTKEFCDDGVVASGGQNQKFALVRALYKNSSILILDEPNSALDAISENKLISNIQKVSENKTTIIISHRLSMVKNVDCIYFMEGGKFVETGSHNELMDRKGKYYEMFTIQSNAYKDDNDVC